MSFFDKSENTVGQLTTQLSSDADAIQNATGTRVANVIKNFMTLATGLFLGFYFSWQIALVGRVTITPEIQFGGDKGVSTSDTLRRGLRGHIRLSTYNITVISSNSGVSSCNITSSFRE